MVLQPIAMRFQADAKLAGGIEAPGIELPGIVEG